MRSFWIGCAALLALAVMTADAGGQGISLTLRGGAGLPLGQFAESPSGPGEADILQGARTGFGYGLDVALLLNRMVGLYAGLDRMAFECEEQACGRDNRYTFSGLTGGVMLTPFQARGLVPWIRGGVTFHELSGSYQAQGGIGDLTSDRAPGYEVGAGVAIPILGILAVTPQVRYLGQSPRARIEGIQYPGGDEVDTNAGYLTFDLGFGFHTPMGGGGWRMQRR
jgi:hypothetical protein